MIAIVGDVHQYVEELRNLVASLPSGVGAILQAGDLWVHPDEADVPPGPDGAPRELPRRPFDPRLHWRRPARDVCFIDGNHHSYPLTRGLTAPTRVAPGLTFLPRGTVLTLPGERGPLRVGVLGGGDSVLDTRSRRLGDDWWPNEEGVTVADVERLLANAHAAGGLDLLVTHTPPATVTDRMTGGVHPPHPSAVLVEAAWRALGGGRAAPPLELIAGHMHASWYDADLRVEVLPMLGVTLR